VDEDESSSGYKAYVSRLYDKISASYEDVFLRNSQYYGHLYSMLYGLFNEYFGSGRIRSRVLDLGSGTGIWSYLLSKLGMETVSLDISFKSLSKCSRVRCQSPVQGDGAKLPFRNEYFDAVLAYGSVVNHVVNAENLFREVSRVLVRGGYFIFDADNIVCPDMIYEGVLGGVRLGDILNAALRGRGCVGRWYAYGNVSIPYRFFTVSEIMRIMSNNSMRIIDMRGIHVVSGIIPSRLHQWGNGKISKLASLLYSLDKYLGKGPLRYLSTTVLVVGRKEG